jgi:PKD repeat protein
MRKLLKYLLVVLPFVVMAACVDEQNIEDLPPTSEDATFSVEPTSENPNIVNFTADREFFRMQWDLGNGTTAEGRTVTGTYPNEGTYTVTLTVFNAAGSASFSQDIVIDQTDPTLLDSPIFNILTGGINAIEGRTWVIDSARVGHFGVGPNPSQAGDFPEWYAAQANEKRGSGMYTDRYTFFLDNFGFNMETNGFVYLNPAQESNFPGAFDPGVGDLSAPYEAPDGLTWSYTEVENGFDELRISEGGFLGYFAGGTTYQIVNLEENEMFLRYVDQANEELSWYIRLIPAGFDSGEDVQEEEPSDVNFNFEDLIGDGTQAWTLKSAAGAFGVGPAPGNDSFFPNGNDISDERACLFNDLYIFSEDGTYEYDTQGDIFAEFYMGVSEEGCQDESNLEGTPGEAWGSGVHSFEFTPGEGSTRPKITVTGTGAFVVLAKAFNGGEYEQGPPNENASVTYDVLDYDPESKELTLTIDITNDGGVWWTFVLVPNE